MTSRLKSVILLGLLLLSAQSSVFAKSKIFLSLDGERMFGLIPALVLKLAEEKSGRRISDCVDGIIATGSGAISAGIVASLGKDGKPRSANDAVEFFLKHGEKIFSTSELFSSNVNAKIFGRKQTHLSNHLLDALEEPFGNGQLGNAALPIWLASADIIKQNIYLFSSDEASKYDGKNTLLSEAIVAASTIFYPLGETVPFEITFDDGASGAYVNLMSEPGKKIWRKPYSVPAELLYPIVQIDLLDEDTVIIFSIETGLESPKKLETPVPKNVTLVRLQPDLTSYLEAFQATHRNPLQMELRAEDGEPAALNHLKTVAEKVTQSLEFQLMVEYFKR